MILFILCLVLTAFGIYLLVNYNDWKGGVGVVLLIVGGFVSLMLGIFALANLSSERHLETKYSRILFDYKVDDSNSEVSVIVIPRSNLSFNQEALNRGALRSLREEVLTYNSDRLWAIQNKDNPWISMFVSPIGNSKYIKVVTE